jgi:hypothetical protein
MRRALLLTISALFIVLCQVLPVAVYGQQSCSELMKYGIYDEYNTLSSKEYFGLFQSWLCSSHFSSYDQAKTESTKLGIGIDKYSLDFGSTTAENNWLDWSDKLCHSDFTAVSSNSQFINTVRVISPALMSVVKQCLEGDSVGMRGWVTTSKDRSQVTFNARYVPMGEEKIKVLSFSTTPAEVIKTCQGAKLLAKNQKWGKGTRFVTCEVEPKQTLTFTLNTTQGGTAVTLERLEQLSPIEASLSASPTSITKGQSATLSWVTRNSTSISIKPDVSIPPGNVEKGALLVTPTSTTTYTLIAAGVGSPAIASTTVQVTEPPPSASFSASSSSIYYGQKLRLSWNTTNANSISIDQGIGAVGASGTKDVTPLVTTIYTLVANGVGAPASQSISIQVNPKMRVWENTGLGGRSLDINGPGNFQSPFKQSISSIQIFTDEWVTFVGFKGLDFGVLVVKGPKILDNLHLIGGQGFNHWGDAILGLADFTPGNSPPPNQSNRTTTIP